MELCTSWKEVTLRQFIELSHLTNDDTVEYNIAVVALMSGKTKEDIEALPFTDLTNYIKKVQFINELPTQHLLPQRIDVNGKRYRVNLNVSELTGGGYIDLKTLTKDPTKIVDNMPLILTCFIKPIKRNWYGRYKDVKVNVDEQMANAEDFKNFLSIDIAYPLCVFFCELYPNLILGIQQYLLKKAQRETKMLESSLKMYKKKRTTTTGDGK